MKTITLQPSIAADILDGRKTTVTLRRKLNYRGRVLVHAASPQNAVLGRVEIIGGVQAQSAWTYTLGKPAKFKAPITGVKAKTNFWQYNGPLQQAAPPKNIKLQTKAPLPSLDELREQRFRKQVSESTAELINNLTLEEQMRVSFVPLIIGRMAWNYAYKALALAAKYRVDILKKISRAIKAVDEKYRDSLRSELDFAHYNKINEQSDMCMAEMNRDLLILYFSVNNEFKRVAPGYPYDDMRSYAIISMLLIDQLIRYNRKVDDFLSQKLGRKVRSTLLPDHVEALRTGMKAFSGVDGKFNYQDKDVTLGMKVIENRINQIHFSIF